MTCTYSPKKRSSVQYRTPMPSNDSTAKAEASLLEETRIPFHVRKVEPSGKMQRDFQTSGHPNSYMLSSSIMTLLCRKTRCHQASILLISGVSQSLSHLKVRRRLTALRHCG